MLEWEREALFLGGWFCAGHADQVRERGQYLTVEVGDESIVVVADDDGVPHAFHNTCRHRGARIVDQPEGRVARLQCPYHPWSYRFDGSLANAPHTDGVLDFDPACFGLHRVRCAVVEGLVLLDPSGEAPPAEEHAGDLAGLLARYRTAELTRTTRLTYEVNANWKVIAENYSECLHCPGVHPELNRLSHYLSGETLTGSAPGAAGRWCSARAPRRWPRRAATATVARRSRASGWTRRPRGPRSRSCCAVSRRCSTSSSRRRSPTCSTSTRTTSG